jgi:transglutaminase-like putative cysteine protease
MRLSITHQTTYAYGVPVESSHHMAYLTPPNSATQQVLSHAIDIDPQPPTPPHTRSDVFGNTVTHWALPDGHRHLRVTARSWIDTHALEPAHTEMTCAQAAQATQVAALSHPGEWPIHVHPSVRVPRHGEWGHLARPDFEPERPLVDAAVAFMQRLHTQLVYDSTSTHVDTPALLALQAGRGVCQDFAHILLAGLRQMGHAACYVSGYLLTQPAPGQARLIGADASHAWVALYVPGLQGHVSRGWLHLDPTNARHGWGSPGCDYVELARGRDFADVSPLRGVLRGGDASPPQVSVTVLPRSEGSI